MWFAVLAALGALAAIATRFEVGRRGRGRAEEERDAIINTRAMSIAGTMLVIAGSGRWPPGWECPPDSRYGSARKRSSTVFPHAPARATAADSSAP